MRFQYENHLYRIAFHHAPSRVWADHAGHEVSIEPADSTLWCDQCSIQLSHVPKAERIRTTSCTIYEEIVENAGGDTRSFELRPVVTGRARPNVAMGDRFEREKGRQVALTNALGELLGAARGFRAAAWAAYLGRGQKVKGAG